MPQQGQLAQMLKRIQHREESALRALRAVTENTLQSRMPRLAQTSDPQVVLNEVYMQIWLKAQDYDPNKGPVISWVHAIFVGRCIDQMRRNKLLARRKRLAARGDIFDSSEVLSAEEMLLAAEQIEMLQNAINQLLEPRRRLISLAFVDDLSHSQISEELQMPIGTVKSNIRRGIAQLREMLAQPESALRHH